MSDPYVEITRREEFCAAHRLHSAHLSDAENQRLYGVCSSLHGHNYAVEVTLRGPPPDATGMLMDLNRLMVLMREEIVERVDHKNLNEDVPFLRGVVPTAENVAIAFWGVLAPRVRDFAGCRLERVRVYESRDNFVDYHGADA